MALFLVPHLRAPVDSRIIVLNRVTKNLYNAILQTVNVLMSLTIMMHNTRDRFLLLSLVLATSIGCDQTTKRIAEQTLEKTHSFLFDTVRLQFIKNSGAFLGFGSDFAPELKIWLFLFFPVVFLLAASAFMIFSKTLRQYHRILIALMISGGIGNLIDRALLSGYVTDFINVGIGPLRTGIFNIADVAIMIGAIGLIVFEIREKILERKKSVHTSAQ